MSSRERCANSRDRNENSAHKTNTSKRKIASFLAKTSWRNSKRTSPVAVGQKTQQRQSGYWLCQALRPNKLCRHESAALTLATVNSKRSAQVAVGQKTQQRQSGKKLFVNIFPVTYVSNIDNSNYIINNVDNSVRANPDPPKFTFCPL